MTAEHLSRARLDALRAGASPDDAEAEHLIDCRPCSLSVEGDDALEAALEGARRAQPDDWGEARLREGQGRLAASLRRQKLARYAAPLFAGALAAAAMWVFFQRPKPKGPSALPELAEVERQPDAALELAQAGPDEVVEVSRGQAAFHVRKLRKAERFRVRCGRDEVEVRGTRFAVRSGGEGFASVEVTEGAVELRTECCGTRLLRAGESWARPAASGALGPAPQPTAEPPAPPPAATEPAPPALNTAHNRPPKGSAEAPPGPREPEPTADGLRQRALEAYDRGDYGLASRSFEAAARLSPDAPWAPDARTLAGAARVLLSTPGSIASLSVGVASLDAAAQRAARSGDSTRAAAARVAAARRSSGEGARKRWCALRHDASISSEIRSEATKACPDGP